MDENYYLVTVTVTYRVDDVKTREEATGIIEHQLLPAPHLDGVWLEASTGWDCIEITETINNNKES